MCQSMWQLWPSGQTAFHIQIFTASLAFCSTVCLSAWQLTVRFFGGVTFSRLELRLLFSLLVSLSLSVSISFSVSLHLCFSAFWPGIRLLLCAPKAGPIYRLLAINAIAWKDHLLPVCWLPFSPTLPLSRLLCVSGSPTFNNYLQWKCRQRKISNLNFEIEFIAFCAAPLEYLDIVPKKSIMILQGIVQQEKVYRCLICLVIFFCFI